MTTIVHYVVCIVAHNEEQVIGDTIQSLLGQELDPSAELAIYVFTNGCSDRTDQIVCDMAKADDRVQLISLRQKGKVYAIRESVEYFRSLHEQAPTFDRVFYVDADVTFPDTKTLAKLNRSLNESEDLYLVSSYPLAESAFVRGGWYLAWLARARQVLQMHFHHNIVRGRCYVIRYHALIRVDYPSDALSDDMYLEIRLNGHYRMDYSILTNTKLKNSLDMEIRRDLFTLIAREQLYQWWQERRITSLDPETKRAEWTLYYPPPAQLMKYLLRTGRLIMLLVMMVWMPIYRYNERRARRILQASRQQRLNLLDYWSTQR